MKQVVFLDNFFVRQEKALAEIPKRWEIKHSRYILYRQNILHKISTRFFRKLFYQLNVQTFRNGDCKERRKRRRRRRRRRREQSDVRLATDTRLIRFAALNSINIHENVWSGYARLLVFALRVILFQKRNSNERVQTRWNVSHTRRLSPVNFHASRVKTTGKQVGIFFFFHSRFPLVFLHAKFIWLDL